MFKGNITSATTVADKINVPFNAVYNTNDNTAYNATTNTVSILKCGFYKIDVDLTAETTPATDYTIQLFTNGVALPDTLRTLDPALDVTTGTLHISDVIRVLPTNLSQYSNISVQVTGTTSVSNGVFIVERVK